MNIIEYQLFFFQKGIPVLDVPFFIFFIFIFYFYFFLFYFYFLFFYFFLKKP